MKRRILTTGAMALQYGNNWTTGDAGYTFEEYAGQKQVKRLLDAFPEDGELMQAFSAESSCDFWVGTIKLDGKKWIIAGDSMVTSENGCIWMVTL